MDFYPPLPEKAVFTLQIILQRMDEDPDFLSNSPYTADEIKVLSLFQTSAEEVIDVPTGDNKWDRLERESNQLFKALTEMGQTLSTKDNTEQMAYFRTATSLLDKIVGIQERTANLKQINRFHDTVLSIMEDILDAGQRTQVMEALRNSINQET